MTSNARLHYTTLHYTTLHYTTLHYTTLHYITLHYTTLHSTHYMPNTWHESTKPFDTFTNMKPPNVSPSTQMGTPTNERPNISSNVSARHDRPKTAEVGKRVNLERKRRLKEIKGGMK